MSEGGYGKGYCALLPSPLTFKGEELLVGATGNCRAKVLVVVGVVWYNLWYRTIMK